MIAKTQASRAASNLIEKYGIDQPNEIPIEDLVYAEGAIIQEKKIKGSDGRILMGRKKSIIVINSEIKSAAKRSFVIGHELGHFKLHKELEQFYNCSEADFLNWHQKGSHESEANQFAAEILMPAEIFQLESAKVDFSFGQICHLARLFRTSITATAIRYTDYGKTPIGVIYSQNGYIRWFSASNKFIYSFFKVKEKVPEKSLAGRYFKSGKIFNKAQVVLPVWFTDFRQRQDIYFYEYCFPIKSQNSTLSFIWQCEDYGLG